MHKYLALTLLAPFLLASCSIDWNDEKEKRIGELEKQIINLKDENDLQRKAIDKFNTEKKEILIWSYFTPHAASRKIQFFRTWKFIFTKWENDIVQWEYHLYDQDLKLVCDNGEEILLNFHKWENDGDMNYYIEWTGEYFVRE